MAVTVIPREKSLAEQMIVPLMQFGMQKNLQKKEFEHQRDLQKTMSAKDLQELELLRMKANTDASYKQAMAQQAMASVQKLKAESVLIKTKSAIAATPMGQVSTQIEMWNKSIGNFLTTANALVKDGQGVLDDQTYQAVSSMVNDLTKTMQEVTASSKTFETGVAKSGQRALDLARNDAAIASAKNLHSPTSPWKAEGEQARRNTLNQFTILAQNSEMTKGLRDLQDEVVMDKDFPQSSKMGKARIESSTWRGKEPIKDVTPKNIAAFLNSADGKEMMKNPDTWYGISLYLLDKGMHSLIPPKPEVDLSQPLAANQILQDINDPGELTDEQIKAVIGNR